MKFPLIISMFSLFILSSVQAKAVKQDLIELETYAPFIDFDGFAELQCLEDFNVVCMDPPAFVELYRKDKTKFEEVKGKLQEKLGSNADELKNKLKEELKNIKKEVLNNENGSLSSKRASAYSAKSLIKQI
mmetsp:Transcript_34262/g.35553  ORF Transcript_34262/g.35553 Transcript_34262/m.35553 type:complete len:131 (-) Transcript_34262:86-478(-)